MKIINSDHILIMKSSIFNFLVLQIVVWAIVFASNNDDKGREVNYAIISDSWKVANVGQTKENDFKLHNPEFNTLTLNTDGTYLRVRTDNKLEKGNWALNGSKTALILSNGLETRNYDIVQLPNAKSQSFIIKENGDLFNSKDSLEYELTRL